MSKIFLLVLLGGATLAAALPVSTAHANKERVLYSFSDGADSALPAGVIRDDKGNLYGTTRGTSSSCSAPECGTVFKITPKGNETALYAFQGLSDGYAPNPGLVRDVAGDLYGTTTFGGEKNFGSVFKVSRRGKKTTLHSFKGFGDGVWPSGSLVMDGAGNLYGTTLKGGTANYGTIYRVSPRGKTVVLYSFPGGSGGTYPNGGLLRDSQGNLFGTTSYGGFDCDGNGQGCGTVFELANSGSERTIYTFSNQSSGAYPAGGLVMDTSGNLYGTTEGGGSNCYGFGNWCGTLFKLTQDGQETVLHVFNGDDGAYPGGGLTIDAAGNLYGSAGGGSAGVVFEYTASGQEKTLYSFTGGSDGSSPTSPLALDENGNLYGATLYGGMGYGTIFKIVNH